MEKYIEFDNISKIYPGVKALSNVSFKAEGGKITALLGENGAGKSTLLKILSGDIQPTTGKLILNGTETNFKSPNDAIQAGISVIYQERQLVPMMTVAENIFLEDMPKKKGLKIIDKKALFNRTNELLKDFGLPINPNEIVGRLSVAYQQMVEIMKAFRRDSDIIAFDEPTAPLAEAEINALFRMIQKLKDEGKVVLYVSHRLAEIFQITDDIVVLKDGAVVNSFKTADTNEAQLIKSMVGRDIGDTYSNLSRNDKLGDVVLDVKNLTTSVVNDVSFTLRKGEILGFAGLVGAGRTETVRAIFGADKVKSGQIFINGKEVQFKSPKEAIEAGVLLCPEDRKEQGLVLSRSITENITMPVLNKVTKFILVNRKKEASIAAKAIDKFAIKTPSANKITVELSGGNQQKVILGRWTSDLVKSDILILDEPTKGIDVGTKAEIYQMVCDFAKEGKAVIFISSELTEVINVSDNIIVMHNGHITGKMARQDANEENVLALAMAD